MSTIYYAKTSNGEETASLTAKTIAILHRIPGIKKIEKDSIIGIKIHFGEKGNVGYINAGLVKGVAEFLRKRSKRVFVTDTNTLYLGSRSNSVDHMQLAYEHGFDLSKIRIPVIIADGVTGRNFTAIDIGGKHLKSVKIASDVVHCEYLVCLSHVTGHMQTGVGGSIKNLGMGCAARAGKLEQHSNVLPSVSQEKCNGCGACLKWCPADAISIEGGKASVLHGLCIGCGECTVACKTGAIEIKWSEEVRVLQEKMAEYALGVIQALGRDKVCFVNFLTHITKDCDCMAKDEPAICDDLGIMASTDPVALDKASVDMLAEANRRDVFKAGYPNIDWSAQIDHAEAIGLGKKTYRLENLAL